MKSIVGFDVETSKKPNHFPWFKGHYLSTVCVSYPDNTARTWIFIHNQNIISVNKYQRQLKEIETELNKFDIVAAHNLKFDRNVLRDLNLTNTYHCTMVAEYLLNQHTRTGLKLDDLSPKYNLPIKIDKVKIMWDSGMDTREIPLSTLVPYCEEDARKARIIAEIQQRVLKKQGILKIFDLQMEWLDLLSVMECNGTLWDKKRADSIIKRYKNYKMILNNKVLKMLQHCTAGPDNILLTSGDELSACIYGGKIKRKLKRSVIKEKNVKIRVPYIFTYKNGNKKIKVRTKNHPETKIIRRVFKDVWFDIPGLGIKPMPKTELVKSTEDCKYYKTDKDTLPFLNTETLLQKRVIKLLLKLSSINKVLATFENEEKKTGLINKIGVDGKLHTNFNQTVTATGRLSSSDPNNQNLPRGNTSPIKQCFIPTFDFILNADLSQIEWRVPAHLSQDPVMIKEINSGVDQHSAACTKLMGLTLNKLNRFYAKRFNFRMIYGGTEWGFFKDSTMPKFPIKRWKQIVTDFYLKYTGLKKWHDKIVSHVINGDGTLTIPTGRVFKFHLTKFGKYNDKQIKNYPVQGMAGGDILPLAAVIIWKAMKKSKLKALPIITVHDSLAFDTPKNEVDKLADLCMKVFNNLPTYINQYWGIPWNVNLTGEVEIGKNYGKMKRIR